MAHLPRAPGNEHSALLLKRFGLRSPDSPRERSPYDQDKEEGENRADKKEGCQLPPISYLFVQAMRGIVVATAGSFFHE